MLDRASLWILKNKKPARCHLLFYCISYRLNMFRALLCPSKGARDYDVDYHMKSTWKGHSCFSLQPRHYSSLTAPNLQPTANQGIHNFRFTILSKTNNTSNYQSTNETHYTQQNTTITTQRITTINVNRNTLSATTKRQTTSHRTHTTKNHNFTLTLPPTSLQNETTNVVINIIVVSSWWWA